MKCLELIVKEWKRWDADTWYSGGDRRIMHNIAAPGHGIRRSSLTTFIDFSGGNAMHQPLTKLSHMQYDTRAASCFAVETSSLLCSQLVLTPYTSFDPCVHVSRQSIGLLLTTAVTLTFSPISSTKARQSLAQREGRAFCPKRDK